MLTAWLSCGTGNQMFQYAMAYAAAKRLGVGLQLDTSYYATSLNHGHRGYNLNLFSGVTQSTVSGVRVTTQEDGMQYNPSIVSRIRDGDCLRGYWQTEKYFVDARDDLLSIFQPRQPLTNRTSSLIRKIEYAGSSSVALSIRRTDRVGDDFGELTPAYYIDACHRVAKRVKDPHFFIFSDDPEWCHNNLYVPYQFTIVRGADITTGDHLGREDEDLLAMSHCHHSVLANSSFSWWGTWLCQVPDSERLVIAPRPWFDNNRDNTQDVVPYRWTSASRKPGRVLVALISCDKPEYKARAEVCTGTWGKNLPENYDLKMCTGGSLGVSDAWGNTERMQTIAKYALDYGYDWVLKTDDDTIINCERLKVPDADYAGWVTIDSRPEWPHAHCQGGCYWLSRRSLEAIERGSTEGRKDMEDRWVADVLAAAGIQPVNLPDFVINPSWPWIRDWRPDVVYNPNWTVLLQSTSGPIAYVEPPKPRVLVGLISADFPKFQLRRQYCLDTWAKSLPPGYDLKVCTGQTLGVSDDYSKLCDKTKAAIKLALDGGYDWLLKVDDDCDVRPHLLAPPVGADYAGWATTSTSHTDYPIPHCQGGCYWLSRKAMNVLIHSTFGRYTAEDRWVGSVLKDHGIIPTHIPTFTMGQGFTQVGEWRPEEVYNPDWAVLLQANNNPNRIISSLWWPSLGVMEQLCVSSYLSNGHDFNLYSYGPCANVPAGAKVINAAEIMPESEIKNFTHIAHFADWFRYNLLLQKGGWWVDMDTVCLKPFSFPDEYVFSQEPHDPPIHGYCNNAYLKAQAGSDVTKWLLEKCKGMDHKTMGWLDPSCTLVTRAVEEFDLKSYPTVIFNPIGWWDWRRLISANPPVLTDETHAIHLWHNAWKQSNQDTNTSYPPDCLYETLKKRYSIATPTASKVTTPKDAIQRNQGPTRPVSLSARRVGRVRGGKWFPI